MPGEAPRSDWLVRAGELIETRRVKLVLAILIVISVLPGGYDQRYWYLFAAPFTVELAIRGALLWRRGRDASNLEYVFLLVDLLAFLSFLPIHDWLSLGSHELPELLVILRLTRLLVLLRFARELARDVHAILTRREQLQQFGLVTAAVIVLSFVAAVVLYQLGEPHDFAGDGLPEDASFLDRMWWSFRQLESADNLVQNLRVRPAIAVVSLLLTIIGVFVISYIIGIGANVVEQVVRAERRRTVGYKGHSLVIGNIAETEILVREFVRIYDKNSSLRRLRPREIWRWLFHGAPRPRRHALPRMALLGPREDPPPFLYEPGMRWVVYREGEGADPEALERVGAQHAKRAILLARSEGGPDADAITIASLAAFRSVNPHAHAFVEVLESHDGEIVHQVGGGGTYALDVPRFLGLFLCHHLIAPGVEALYRDLLTAEGSEIYTHVFVEKEELDAVARLAKDGTFPFAHLARRALVEHGVVLCGAFLGEGLARRHENLISLDGLTQWLNPHTVDPDDARVAGLGGKPGEVPIERLRGLIGIATSYPPLRHYARQLLDGSGLRTASVPDAELEAAREVARGVFYDERAVQRVLIVGYSSALPSLLHALARFVPDVEVVLVLGQRGDEHASIGRRLASLRVGLDGTEEPGIEGVRVPLERGGSAMIHTHSGSDLASFAVNVIGRSKSFDVAVFLSEPDSADRDARTALRVLRFARALLQGQAPRGQTLHILAEFGSLRRGERLKQNLNEHRCGFQDPSAMRMTLVSTEQIKNYFMVHSAFVPGVTAIYDRLIGIPGQEILRVEVPPGEGPPLTFAALSEAFEARRTIPIAIGMRDGRVILNPPPRERIDRGAIECLFVIADSSDLLAPHPPQNFAEE